MAAGADRSQAIAIGRPTQVFIACSPHPRVGKSLTARLLGDYYLSGGRDIVVFDTNPHEPALPRFFGERCIVADLATARGQIALIDRILVADGISKVVDLWHVSYQQFFALSEELGFFGEAQRASVEPIFLVHSDETSTVVETCMQVAKQWPKRGVVVVHDEGAVSLNIETSDLFERLPSHRRLVVPRFDPVLKQILNRSDFCLGKAVRDRPDDISIVVLSGLRAWLGRVFGRFQRLELRLALDSAQYLG